MPETSISLCNRALARVGSERISSFDDGGAASDVAGREYESLVTERLSGTFADGRVVNWRFAMELAEIGVPLADEPADKWQYAYNLPADLLAIRAVRRGNGPVPFDRYGDKLFCDAEADVVIEYTFRQVEAKFPPYFTAALVVELASVFAMALNRDLALARELRLLALGDGSRNPGFWGAARLADSQGRTTERFGAGRLVSARR